MKLALLFAFMCMIVATCANPGPPGPPPSGGPPPAGGPPKGPPPTNFTASFTRGAGFASNAAAPPPHTPPPPKSFN